MQIIRTSVEGGFVEVAFSDDQEGGEQIAMRMRAELAETKSLALHRYTSLHRARDVIGSEMARLKILIDQTS